MPNISNDHNGGKVIFFLEKGNMGLKKSLFYDETNLGKIEKIGLKRVIYKKDFSNR